MAELKPCPFCGGEAKFDEDNSIDTIFSMTAVDSDTYLEDINVYEVSVSCSSCGIRTKKIVLRDASDLEIIKAKNEIAKTWNTRVKE